jgi:heme/copper-type cytochrome/quinol oxidase subunit 4
MSFDIPHMVATAVIIFAVIWGVDQLTQFQNMSRGRKSLMTFVVLLVALTILNIVWPYSSGG